MVRPLVITNEMLGRGTHHYEDCQVRGDLADVKAAWRDVRPFGADPTGVADSAPAIQRAIELSATGAHDSRPENAPIYLPAGYYRLNAPLQLDDYITLKGVPGRTFLFAATAGNAVIDARRADNTRYVTVDGLTFSGVRGDSYGVRGPDDRYLSMWRVRNCRFMADLTIGMVGQFANCSWEGSRFGFQGTPGAVHQAVLSGDSATLFSFSNQFYNCWFGVQKGAAAAVEYGLAHNLSFFGCTFDTIQARVLKARGVTTILFAGCNFEKIAPADAPLALFDLATDTHGLGNRSFLHVIASKFSLTDGDAEALVFHDNVTWSKFETSSLAMPNHYWTLAAGPTQNSCLSVHECRATGDLGDVLELGHLTAPLALRSSLPMQIVPRALAPGSSYGNEIYLDDGSNTMHGRPGFRHWDGAAWQDVGGEAGGTVSHDYGGGAATWSLTAAEARARYVYLANTGGAAIAQWPRALPGIQIVVNNTAGHNVTCRVGGAGGTSVTAGKRALLFFTGSNLSKLYEEP